MATRPGLHGDWKREIERRAEPESRNARDRIAQDIDHECRGAPRHDPATLLRIGAHSARHGPPPGWSPHAAVWQHAVRVRQLQQGHVAVSKGEPQTVVVGRPIERYEPRELEGPQEARRA